MAGTSSPLEMSLDIVADVREATVGAQDGRIELVALGDTAVLARLEYRGVLVATHATGIAGAPRDAFETQPQAPARDRPASIDFPL